MSEIDGVMEGLMITGFSLIGLSALGYYIRQKLKDRIKMKQSASMEDLTSVDTTDPESNV